MLFKIGVIIWRLPRDNEPNLCWNPRYWRYNNVCDEIALGDDWQLVSYVYVWVSAVTNRSADFCRRHSELRIPLTSQTGSNYVASLMTSDAPTCARSPWSVEASPGQHVNITLWDFTTVSHQRLSASSSLYGSDSASTRPRSINTDAAGSDAAAALFVETAVTCRESVCLCVWVVRRDGGHVPQVRRRPGRCASADAVWRKSALGGVVRVTWQRSQGLDRRWSRSHWSTTLPAAVLRSVQPQCQSMLST